jgi:NMD protein affecting ribosome stability and mRNA decay
MERNVCHYCGRMITSGGGHVCDSCWRLKWRIVVNLDIARKIVEELDDEGE